MVPTYATPFDAGHVWWSDEDDCYIAHSNRHQYASAHGETAEEAMAELRIAAAGCDAVLGEQLAPGSPEAIAAGCKCPRWDNANGRGRGKDEHGNTVFVQRGDCPLHGWELHTR